MAEVSIKSCLRVWRRKYGEEKVGKTHGQTYWKIPVKDRRRLIIIFLRWMRMLGMEEERFRKASFFTELIDICFGNAPAFDEKRRKNGHAALKEELEDILDTEGVFSGKRAKTNKNSVPTRLVPLKQLTINDFKPSLPPEADFKPVGREINRELYKKDADFEPIMDEEFAALIGVSKDE